MWSCNSVDIVITEGDVREGQECFKIITPHATYFYQKEAGGFSNILDENGTDWIQFKKTANAEYPRSAAADYRGLPNLVFRSEDGGCGHPGSDKMISEVVEYNKIRSISKSGKWQWVWSFNQNYAELEIEKIDEETPFWFLIEGPIAGKFSPTTHYWGTSNEGPINRQPDLVKGPEEYAQWQSIYFGDTNYNNVMFAHQLQKDTLQDLYTYMGNTIEGNASPDGMVVFGFGRAPSATPLLKVKQKFRIGFYQGKIIDENSHKTLLTYINQL